MLHTEKYENDPQVDKLCSFFPYSKDEQMKSVTVGWFLSLLNAKKIELSIMLKVKKKKGVVSMNPP